jgi:tRNA pseudouridine38-40 synthase
MRNIKLIISYDGTNFLGWQKTASGPSIEQALEDAIYMIVKKRPSLQAASRTDAGVHARGQVVNFILDKEDIDLSRLQRSLNGVLSQEIRVIKIYEEDQAFHPTIDNEGKNYRYYLCMGPCQIPFFRDHSWHFPYALDLKLMREAADLLTGYKDFACFCNERADYTRSTFCRIDEIKIEELGNYRLCISIKGSRFLYKMVRNMVGTLAYIGSGKIELRALEKILQSKIRSSAGMTAPAHGLELTEVYYPKQSASSHGFK